MNCKGDEDIDAKRSRPSIGKPGLGHARKERVLLIGTDQRITSGRSNRPHSKAGYMTAPERFADSQVPLPPRTPSSSVKVVNVKPPARSRLRASYCGECRNMHPEEGHMWRKRRRNLVVRM